MEKDKEFDLSYLCHSDVEEFYQALAGCVMRFNRSHQLACTDIQFVLSGDELRGAEIHGRANARNSFGIGNVIGTRSVK